MWMPYLCFRVLYIADNILCFDVIGEQDDNYISCHKIQFTLCLSLSKSQRIWDWAKTEMLKIQRNRFSSKWQSQWSNKWKEHKECDQVIRKGQYIMSYIWHPLWSSSSESYESLCYALRLSFKLILGMHYEKQ
jgi:hypothetical protein